MIEIEEVKERVILVAVCTGDEAFTAHSLDELEDLAETAGAITVGRLVQNLDHPQSQAYLGSGKLAELRELVEELGATGVICDDELTPAQMRNMEDCLECKVMDRTLVILDIFAAHAVTSEGKIQVELAQLRYRSTRLVGLRNSLSRLGGGIGTRGPGEKKLEMDRRLIHQRIGQLKAELEQVKRHRDTARKQRMGTGIPVAAIVGYTNAGKSTLLNRLTDAGVLEQNQLFATLDPTTRLYTLQEGDKILLTDTVGFINKLPHHLVDAFRSTLEEAKYADIILHVVDASDPMMDMHMHVVYQTLQELGVEDKIYITLFNKQDRVEGTVITKDFKADHTLSVSALTGQGLDQLDGLLTQILRSRKIYVEQVVPYAQAGKIQLLRKVGQLLFEEYTEEGIAVKGYLPVEYFNEFMS